MLIRKKSLSLAVILILLSSLLLTACSGDGKQSSNGGQEKVEISIFQFKVEIANELEAAVKEYQDKNQNVKINLETVGGGDDYGAALRAKFQSGNEPTIFNVGGPQDVEDWTHKLENLSDQPWVDLALHGVLSGVTVDGKVYGLPFNMEGYGLIYNKRIFEAAGINPSEIRDFASLEAAVKLLDDKINNGELKEQFPLLEAVFEYPAKETWVTGLHTSNMFLGQEFESSLAAFDAKTLDFKYANQLKSIIDLQADYSPNAKTKNRLNAVDYSTQVEQGLAMERVAIIQQGNWVFGGVNSINKEVAENLGLLPMPVVGVKENTIPVGIPMYWTVNKDSSDAQREVAKDFLNWLYTSDTGKEYIVNKFYFIPPFEGFDKLQPSDPLSADILKFAEAGNTTPWVFMGYPTAWGMDVLGVNIQKYFAGEFTWEQVVEDSKAKWQEMR
ncbi:ABC transporter substrate-binding protein [Alkaliphilus peptidifermentans]|uniref:Raffinose/stachyose/melibiose transport system substrate-binding protein n=1 Tax=Alkaliphilus peptidifermentans DSM 18978 TaxID=1120976 RepID=A0A1G5J2W1_9FIRM|nr:extracellular solute-binding protein [Alkaliphilus peptidifermentans]SCY82597.1 raffinose/stachyose/melibiose transport system substrate-binding protein [Alkaliphilus peptidifermentans DSM 18978]